MERMVSMVIHPSESSGSAHSSPACMPLVGRCKAQLVVCHGEVRVVMAKPWHRSVEGLPAFRHVANPRREIQLKRQPSMEVEVPLQLRSRFAPDQPGSPLATASSHADMPIKAGSP